ncbi:hypothetical protein Sango_2809000 [Sesamum angolense]|uniref:Uncharacterized protein n=1 Tax=Sesamum angolense TaxID=2727404 RepID=A0AAE1T8E7_9LAMI|nr:hypothetical protein Sango_2809000 [Sesamum angolense]
MALGQRRSPFFLDDHRCPGLSYEVHHLGFGRCFPRFDRSPFQKGKAKTFRQGKPCRSPLVSGLTCKLLDSVAKVEFLNVFWSEYSPRRTTIREKSYTETLGENEKASINGCDSESLKNEKGKNPALSSAAVIHEGFGDTGDGEPEEYRSQKFKKNYADVSQVENEDEISKVPKEDELRESDEEGTKTTLKGKAVVPPAGSPPVVSEIPLRFPSPCPNQMATLNLSSIIGIDPNQFDPATYVEEDFYVADASGVNRLIPPTNIIRWREVTNPDRTTSV